MTSVVLNSDTATGVVSIVPQPFLLYYLLALVISQFELLRRSVR